ncbi:MULTISPECIES: glycosyltransferase family 9 protein [Actinokineospora]|uniref:Glycosyl transferase n=1 Tax=Actinokineospora fastidiosa TaxID=1816 RepID=A0A918LDS7_9PSEU|nr:MULTISPECIES: glycosyltransferase family 9 protein [Actinokineospora]UVS80339.1 ADP-heptose--LPS heptosyltransferase 2 [Actinokineospora sp. UTMC 2448]GGS34584.1 glycosyl transferase [Actinokineospora fastidiosa]
MILVLRALKLGDLLVAVPALRALRAHWPDQRVLYACQPWLAPVLRLTGSVDELVPVHGLEPLPERLRGVDVAVNMHGAGPTSTEILDALAPARRIGHAPGWPGPEWRDDLHERDRWCRLLTAHGIPADPAAYTLDHPGVASPAPGAVLVHPGAAYGSKRWPAERFAAVARALRADGHHVVVTGVESERPLAERVAAESGADCLAGHTPLDTLAALIADARLLVSGDTGVAHLATAYRTPSVVLFGPVGPEQWGPPATGPHVTLTAATARRGDPFADDPDPALLGVTVEEVVAAATGLLDHHRAA